MGVIGKTVLVTGAAKRVGRSIARELHAAGANVAVHYRRDAEAAAMLFAAWQGQMLWRAAGGKGFRLKDAAKRLG